MVYPERRATGRRWRLMAEIDEKLERILVTTTRTDERTLQMQKSHTRDVAAVHKRIGEVREESKSDIQDVRGEMKRLTTLISTGISAVVAAVSAFFKGNA